MINQINQFINKFVREGKVRLIPWLLQTSTFIVLFLLLAFLILDVLSEQRLIYKYSIFSLFVLFLINNDVKNYWQIKGLQLMYNEIKYINKVTEALRSTMKLEDLLDMILENLTAELRYERAFIFLTHKVKGKEFLKGEIGVGVLNDILKEQVFELDTSNGIIARTAVEKKPFIIKDAKNDYRCEQKLVELLNLKEFAAIPLIARNEVLGVLVIVVDGYTKKSISSEDITLLDIFANQSAIAIQNARLYKKIEQLSITDGLTLLYNHRYFHEMLKSEFSQAIENKTNVSLIYFDIDDFKYYNDTFGHLTGDNILREIGNVLRASLDDTSIPARYGGEEFAIILPKTSKKEAFILAEKLRIFIENYDFEHKKELPDKKLTISLGVSSFPDDAEIYKDLIRIADKRLYSAKKSGKNRTCVK